MPSVEQWDRINEIVLDIYRAQNVTELRWNFMRELADVVPYQSIFSDLRCIRRGREVCFDPLSPDISGDDLAAYYDRFIAKDFTSWATSQSQVISAYRDSDFISDGARRESELYREWMQPRDILYGSCINIAYQGADYGTVTLGRSESKGDFTDEELEALKILAQHLSLKFHLLYPAGIPYPEQTDVTEQVKSMYRLTNREVEVCQLIYNGLSTQEAACALSISVNTLNRHLANIFKKTDVNSRVALMHKIKDVIAS